jgi:hypothetical protein
VTSYNEPVFRLSKYIEGYYCKDQDSINSIKSKDTRALLKVLSESFPLGQTEADLKQNEDIQYIPKGTVEGSLTTLRQSGFLLRDERNKERSKKTQRLAYNHFIENMNSVSNEYFGYRFEFAPGYVKYTPNFLQVWNTLVEKKDEDEIYPLLVKVLRKAFTKIEGSNNPLLRELKPKTESQDGKEMHCTSCGTNHEARDFIRAVLLRLIDQLEINEGFFDFMNEKHFFDKENTNPRDIYMKSKQEAAITQAQRQLTQSSNGLPYTTFAPKRESQEHKSRDVIKLRILSIEKDTGRNKILFLAIDGDKKIHALYS